MSATGGRRVTQIDLLKGLAILGVMAQHAFTASALHRAWYTVHVGQAVPVFFILMAVNAAGSLRRRDAHGLAEMYSGAYVRGRVRRLIWPLLALWPVALVAASLTGRLHIGPLAAVGVLPISDAPGNYFITTVLSFAVIFPALYWLWARWPAATIIACFALDVAFEVAAPHVAALSHGSYPYAYDASILRFLAAIAVGLWLSGRPAGGNGMPRWLPVAAVFSLAYVAYLHGHGVGWLIAGFGEPTNVLAVFYPLLLVVAGLRYLPERAAGSAARAIVGIGAASYEIFLVQLVWFAVVSNRSALAGISGILLCSLAGYVFAAGVRRLTNPRLDARGVASTGGDDDPGPKEDEGERERERERI